MKHENLDNAVSFEHSGNQAMVRKALKILEERARTKKDPTIFYGDLYPELGLNTDSQVDRKVGADILADVNIESWRKHKVLLSSVVCLKAANGPAEGFYNFAKWYGLLKPGMDELEFWVDAFQKVSKAYRP